MLSKRLQCIADLVDTKSIIDVGCDHALLCIYLTQCNICCRGTDISEKVIANANKNIKKYGYTNKIDLIKTDGLKNVEVKNSDTIILAGMGTNNILNILKDFKLNNQIIISSNNDLYLLRKEMVKKGYYIAEEKVIYEKKHYYVIIKFKIGIKKYNKYDYLLGPASKNDKEYMNYLMNKYEIILLNLPIKYIFKRFNVRKIIQKIKKLNN